MRADHHGGSQGNGLGPVSYEETSSFSVVKRRFVGGNGGSGDHCER